MREKSHQPPPVLRRAGQAMSIGRSLMTIFGFAIVYALASAPFERMETAFFERTTHPEATTGLEYTTQMFGNFLFLVVGVCAIGTIAVAVYQRRGR